MTTPILAIHGGAGVILRETMTVAREELYHSSLQAALISGYRVLKSNGSALDAVTESVKTLEDDPLFNAGRGSVFTQNSTIEMDASVMDGLSRRAGAVSVICGPRHPILAARAVMERTPHVFLAGPGAAQFCKDIGLEHCDPAWFATERRFKELQDQLANKEAHGTVGAVAVDSMGNVAVATSTGGRTGKMVGRVGDTPIVGAGSWADNDTCAVSGTGDGEFFIRLSAAHEVHARMRWGGQTLNQACEAVVSESLVRAGGAGGMIAVDAHGNVSMPFNCQGMYRGYVQVGSDVLHTAIFREDFRGVKINAIDSD